MEKWNDEVILPEARLPIPSRFVFQEPIWRRHAAVIAHPSTRALATVLEQALFAGTNFFVTILLVRWLPIEEMGAYSFASSIFFLTVMVFEAIVSDPAPLLGPGKYAARMAEYCSAVLWGYAIVGFVLMSCLLTAAFVLSQSEAMRVLSFTTFGAALAAPLLFLRPLTQQLCYTNSHNGAFTLAGVAYAVAAPAYVYFLHASNSLSSASAFGALALATSLPCVFVIVRVIQPSRRHLRVRAVFRRAMSDHWRYGRWASIAQSIYWLGSNAYYLAGPLVLGLEATAAVRALFNLILPIQMTNAAILSTFNPLLAKFHFRREADKERRLAGLLAVGLSSLAALYALCVIFGGRAAVNAIYRGVFDRMLTEQLIVWLAIIPLVTTLNAVIETRMRVAGAVKWVAVTKAIWASATVTIGLGACAAFGLTGAFFGLALTTGMTCCANVYAWRMMARHDSKVAPEQGKTQ